MAATPLKGLVLAGGFSTRMGTDKGLIKYHGIPQRHHAAFLLNELGLEAWISLRPEQVPNPPWERYLFDNRSDIGPVAGLLSAIEHDPTAAWLMVPCDLPRLSSALLGQLVESRYSAGQATAFVDPYGHPQPLVSIWEPASFDSVKANVDAGHYSLYRILMASDKRLIEPSYPEELLNVNTPIEALGWKGASDLHLPE